MWGFGGFLLVICNVDGSVGAIKIENDGTVRTKSFAEFDGDYTDKYADNFKTRRSVVAFNVYEGGAIDGKYVKKLLVFRTRYRLILTEKWIAP